MGCDNASTGPSKLISPVQFGPFPHESFTPAALLPDLDLQAWQPQCHACLTAKSKLCYALP